MTKTFKLIDLDCAHCAQKMEDAIAKLPGVDEVKITFMTQKMVITAADDKFDDIMKKAQKTIQKIEPDCTIDM